jgi:hypothetical protein
MRCAIGVSRSSRRVPRAPLTSVLVDRMRGVDAAGREHGESPSRLRASLCVLRTIRKEYPFT